MDENTKKNLERFMAELDNLDWDDLPGDDFHGKVLDIVKWGVYQRIVKALSDLPARCEGAMALDYLEVPNPGEKEAMVKVTLPQVATFDGEMKTALAAAVLLCDRWYITAIGGKIRLHFVVGDVWKK